VEKAGPAAGSPAGAANGADQLVGLDWSDWKHDEQTQVDVGRDFTYREKDMTITGERARYDGKAKVLDASGNLVLDDPQHHLTADKGHIERNKKLAIFTEHVVMVLKPEAPEGAPAPGSPATGAPSGPAPGVPAATAPGAAQGAGARPAATGAQPQKSSGSDESPDSEREQARKRGATVTCDRVEDYYSSKRKFAILTGHVVFTQIVKRPKDGTEVTRTLLCEHATYDGVNEKMKLFAPVHGYDTDHQDLQADKDVLVGTKEKEETLETQGHIKLLFKPEEDETEPNEEPAQKPGPPAPTPGPSPKNGGGGTGH
jgi:hypothetical protein